MIFKKMKHVVLNIGHSSLHFYEAIRSAFTLDSDKFPTATFNGKITNLKDVNFKKDGTYTAAVEGELTIHGVTNTVKTTADFVVAGKAVNGKTAFTIALSDYKVDGPAIGAGKVAKEPKITVAVDFN